MQSVAELLRNSGARLQTHKEKRLRLLAKRAGDLSVKAYLGGNRERAYFFLRKMNAILRLVLAELQEE